MAWAYVQTVEGMTIDAYDRITSNLNPAAMDGLIIHVAGQYDPGFRIIDVWESEENFKRFRQHQLAAAISESLGHQPSAEYAPSLQGMEVHNLILGQTH
jgi:heme-degrading monooxygenase HmoA